MARPKLKPGEKGNYNKSRKQLQLEKIKRSERAALKKKKAADLLVSLWERAQQPFFQTPPP